MRKVGIIKDKKAGEFARRMEISEGGMKEHLKVQIAQHCMESLKCWTLKTRKAE